MQTNANITTEKTNFPFRLEDLKSWTIRRNDGTVTKFVLTNRALPPAIKTPGTTTPVASTYPSTVKRISGFADYCTHKPDAKNSLAFFDRGNGEYLRLWIANLGGAKMTWDDFNFVIDGGDVLPTWARKNLLDGDQNLIDALTPYTLAPTPTRVLKLDWPDRQAPPVEPEFWVQLNKLIYGDVMTCCIGGHGRSGSAFVYLMMVNAPDYDALDAILHVRAVHCPRAIESTVQHDYINEVATYLKREANGKEISKVIDYKAAFMASQKPTAIATRIYLGWDKVEEKKEV